MFAVCQLYLNKNKEKKIFIKISKVFTCQKSYQENEKTRY